MITSDELAQKFDHEFSLVEKWVSAHPRVSTVIILVLGLLELIHVVGVIL